MGKNTKTHYKSRNGRFQARAIFGRSTSPSYQSAVARASEFTGYVVAGEGRSIKHTVSIDVPLADTEKIREFIKLVEIIGGWKSASVEVMTRSLPRWWELTNSLNEVDLCYRQREQSGLGIKYCNFTDSSMNTRTLGCRKLGVGYPTSYGSQIAWIDVGTISKDAKKFTTDKIQLTQLAEQSTEAKLCHLCPAFDCSRVSAEIKSLPDQIDIDSDSRLEVIKGDGITGRETRLKFVGNVSRLRSHSVDFTDRSVDDHKGNESKSAQAVPESRSIARRVVPDTRFGDIVGQDYAISQIKNLIQLPLLHPEYFSVMGIEPPNGVLLYGPPGNGKTMLARAAACESNAHLEIVSGPELRNKYVGETERQIREVFHRAQRFSPSIILLDEIDSIAGFRGSQHSVHDGEVAQLLVLLDGVIPLKQVVIIGTTNRPDQVDSAIRRPGRLDYLIKVDKPDGTARVKLLQNLLRKGGIGIAQVDIREIAKSLNNWSAAEVSAFVREAKLIAVQNAATNGIPADQCRLTRADLECGLKEITRKRQIR